MSLEIPTDISLDERITPQFSVVVDHHLIKQLQLRGDIVYPVDFKIFGQVSPRPESDEISPTHFVVAEPDGQKIIFTVMSARMLGWHIGITRGELLAEATLRNINRGLKKGQVSFCTVYDALLLWHEFDAKSIDCERWIGIKPLKTQKLKDGIFQLRQDAQNKTRLLLGDMYSQITFSSQCGIILRYRPI